MNDRMVWSYVSTPVPEIKRRSKYYYKDLGCHHKSFNNKSLFSFVTLGHQVHNKSLL